MFKKYKGGSAKAELINLSEDAEDAELINLSEEDKLEYEFYSIYQQIKQIYDLIKPELRRKLNITHFKEFNIDKIKEIMEEIQSHFNISTKEGNIKGRKGFGNNELSAVIIFYFKLDIYEPFEAISEEDIEKIESLMINKKDDLILNTFITFYRIFNSKDLSESDKIEMINGIIEDIEFKNKYLKYKLKYLKLKKIFTNHMDYI
jgi:hypothetical protein